MAVHACNLVLWRSGHWRTAYWGLLVVSLGAVKDPVSRSKAGGDKAGQLVSSSAPPPTYIYVCTDTIDIHHTYNNIHTTYIQQQQQQQIFYVRKELD